jgi:cell division protein FtsW
MPRIHKRIDRPFLIVTLVLVTVGFFIFISASLGLLARDQLEFSSVAKTQFFFGICGGLIALAVSARVPYRWYRRFAPYLYVGALVLTALVFVPALSYEANGARRWLLIFGQSFQPAEVLKIAFVLCLAWYYSVYHSKLGDYRYALGGLFIMLGTAGILLLSQPDTGTFALIAAAAGAMSLVAGMRVRHMTVLVGLLFIGIVLLALARPYVFDRITTFLDPANDPHGSGYQIKQSLIAVGSGELIGRGFGQSVQKFNYLPEPMGDSIFSVAAEEFGLLGSVILVLLFLIYAVRGFQIASRTPDRFGGLVVVGIVILVVMQAFMNMGSMLGLVPLTGAPLTFVSHGGTALFFALLSTGIVLNISRYAVVTKRIS